MKAQAKTTGTVWMESCFGVGARKQPNPIRATASGGLSLSVQKWSSSDSHRRCAQHHRIAQQTPHATDRPINVRLGGWGCGRGVLRPTAHLTDGAYHGVNDARTHTHTQTYTHTPTQTHQRTRTHSYTHVCLCCEGQPERSRAGGGMNCCVAVNN